MATIDNAGVDEEFPLISEPLLRKLQEMFPEKCPTIEMTEREIWIYSGQVKLVNMLESVYIEQNNLQN